MKSDLELHMESHPSYCFQYSKPLKSLILPRCGMMSTKKKQNKTNTGSICWELGEKLNCVLRTQQDEKAILVGVIREAFVEELALVLNLRPQRKQAPLNCSLNSQVKRWAHLWPDIPIFSK